jgi:hypothetical protein
MTSYPATRARPALGRTSVASTRTAVVFDYVAYKPRRGKAIALAPHEGPGALRLFPELEIILQSWQYRRCVEIKGLIYLNSVHAAESHSDN